MPLKLSYSRLEGVGPLLGVAQALVEKKRSLPERLSI